jgi:excisionase family DNA binding protein
VESIDRTAADTLTIAEAATSCGLNERTLRRWVATGKLPSRLDAAGRGRLVNGAELRAFLADRGLSGPDRTLDRTLDRTVTGQSPDSDRTDDRLLELARIEERLAAAERERERMAAELEFARAQITAARQAESELRVLLLEQARALQSVTAPKALPPADPPRRRWWRAWWRSTPVG